MTDHKSREALRVRFAKIIIEMQLLAGLLDRFTYEEAAPVAFAAADRILAILPVAPVVGERGAHDWRGPCARHGAALEEIAWPVDGRDTVASLAAIARRAIGVPAARTPEEG